MTSTYGFLICMSCHMKATNACIVVPTYDVSWLMSTPGNNTWCQILRSCMRYGRICVTQGTHSKPRLFCVQACDEYDNLRRVTTSNKLEGSHHFSEIIGRIPSLLRTINLWPSTQHQPCTTCGLQVDISWAAFHHSTAQSALTGHQSLASFHRLGRVDTRL